MRYQVTVDGEQFDVDVAEGPSLPRTAVCHNAGGVKISSDDLESKDAHEHVLHAEGQRIEVYCADLLKRGQVTVRGLHREGPVRAAVQVKSAQDGVLGGTATAREIAVSSTVRATMPGRIAKVLVEVGSRVTAGAPLLIVEAMKMENELVAPVAGVIGAVHVGAGQTVESNAPLVDIVPAAANAAK